MKRKKLLMRLDGEHMVIGIKDLVKLFAITIVSCCAVFVCSLFLNYNIDIANIKDEVATVQGMIMYDALVASGKVTAGVTGGCLVITTVIMLIFYIKNYIDSHGKELGILKALGYSRLNIAKHFWVFGLSVFTGSFLGYIGAIAYMPTFYEVQNGEGLFPQMSPQFHFGLVIFLVLLPTLFFMLLSVAYAYLKMKNPVLHLLKEVQRVKVKIGKCENEDLTFLEDLKKSTVRSRKILVFFVAFSAFCFSAMTQMSMSMKDLASETFAWMIISIGLILAFMTLLMSLTSVIKANTKTIAMMKVFGYSQKECSHSILNGYRPVSYIGFVVGTVYQYVLLRIMVDIVFANLSDMPEYSFDYKALMVSLVAFVVSYELILYCYSEKIGRQSVKCIMLE